MFVCLFDIDGTLLTSGGAGKTAMERALAAEFGVTAIPLKIPFSGRTDQAIVRDILGLHDIEATPANWARFMACYLGHLPNCLATHEGRVLPGVAALLERLAEREEVALGLLTGNVRDGAYLKLRHYALHQHFPFGGFGDLHLDRDAVAHEAIAAARRHLGRDVAGERLWVIGDTPLDIRCARAIQAKVAAVATGWHSVEELAAQKPDLLFEHLEDPTALLERLI